jgi:hypothetical protein
MKHESRDRPPQPAHLPKPEAKDPDAPKERAEAAEVAGRHKNSGQKDHKGAR